jgi:hypothetical protein
VGRIQREIGQEATGPRFLIPARRTLLLSAHLIDLWADPQGTVHSHGQGKLQGVRRSGLRPDRLRDHKQP